MKYVSINLELAATYLSPSRRQLNCLFGKITKCHFKLIIEADIEGKIV